MELSVAEWSWMAGIIDGEGTLTITKQIRPGRPSPAYRPIAQVTNTDAGLVQPFYDAFGGGIYERPDKRTDKSGNNWATAWTWHCPDRQLTYFLEGVRPFLRSIKAVAADIIVQFIERKRSFPRHKGSVLGFKGGSAPLGPEEVAFREALWLKVKTMNSKGVYARSAK